MLAIYPSVLCSHDMGGGGMGGGRIAGSTMTCEPRRWGGGCVDRSSFLTTTVPPCLSRFFLAPAAHSSHPRPPPDPPLPPSNKSSLAPPPSPLLPQRPCALSPGADPSVVRQRRGSGRAQRREIFRSGTSRSPKHSHFLYFLVITPATNWGTGEYPKVPRLLWHRVCCHELETCPKRPLIQSCATPSTCTTGLTWSATCSHAHSPATEQPAPGASLPPTHNSPASHPPSLPPFLSPIPPSDPSPFSTFATNSPYGRHCDASLPAGPSR